MAYFKWNKNVVRDLQREIDGKLGKLKIKVPVESATTRDDVANMSERERRLLLWLVENDSASLPVFHQMADALETDVPDIADACRRLQSRGYLEVKMVSGGEQNYFVMLDDEGRIAGADLRTLPERERKRADAERREKRKKRWQTVHEKYLAPLIVGLLLFWVGWFSKTACTPSSPPRPVATSQP